VGSRFGSVSGEPPAIEDIGNSPKGVRESSPPNPLPDAEIIQRYTEVSSTVSRFLLLLAAACTAWLLPRLPATAYYTAVLADVPEIGGSDPPDPLDELRAELSVAGPATTDARAPTSGTRYAVGSVGRVHDELASAGSARFGSSLKERGRVKGWLSFFLLLRHDLGRTGLRRRGQGSARRVDRVAALTFANLVRSPVVAMDGLERLV
jgi:hypothetical protein